MRQIINTLLICGLLAPLSYAGEAVSNLQDSNKESNYYIGISIGSTDHSSTDNASESYVFHSSDRHPTGHRVTLGMNISPIWAVEFSYVDLGIMERKHSNVVIIENTQRTDVLDFSIVAKKDINYLIDTIYIKAGPSYYQTRAHSIRIPEGAYTQIKNIQEETHFDLHYGLGISKNIYKNIDLLFEVSKYNVQGTAPTPHLDEGDSQTTRITDDNIHMFSLGINYKF